MNKSTNSTTASISPEKYLNYDKTTKVVVSDYINTMTRKPKRPLSAYNLFFKHQRQLIISSHGRMGFQDLARNVASKWKDVDPKLRNFFQSISSKDKIRYKEEMGEWKKMQNRRNHLSNKAYNINGMKKLSSPKKLKKATLTKKLYDPAHTSTSTDTNQVSSFTRIPVSSINKIAPAINGNYLFGTISTNLSHAYNNSSIVTSNSYLNSNNNGILPRYSCTVDSDNSATEPKPILPLYNTSLMLGKPLISDLAKKIDEDCLEVLLTSFANPLFMVEEMQ